LQRFYSQKFSIREKRFCCRVFRAVEPTIIRSHCWPQKAAFA